MRRRAGVDHGFTILELLVAVTVLGVVIIPLGNFMISYFGNTADTQTRLSYSHDAQITAAYFSEDVANTGLRNPSTNTPVQSVWTSGFPATYCGRGGSTTSTVLLLEWDNWSSNTSVPGAITGLDAIDSVAYVIRGGDLHRVFCPGTASGSPTASTVEQSDADLVHTYSAAAITCSTACNGVTPPTSVSMALTISTGAQDTSALSVTLNGQRRQLPS